VNVRIVGPALADASDIADAYEAFSPGLGPAFFDAIRAFSSRIGRLPRMYERIRSAPRGREVRRGMLRRFPFVAVYEVTTTELLIIDFYHARSLRRCWRQRL
jgi:hypothetical protein